MSNPFSASIGITPSDERVSTVLKLPSVDDLDRQIAQLTQQIAGLANGGVSRALAAGFQSKLNRLKQQRREALGGPLSQNGIPPAPDAPGTFANQIATPAVGLDALTIPL
jgi:hypothetical protein